MLEHAMIGNKLFDDDNDFTQILVFSIILFFWWANFFQSLLLLLFWESPKCHT